MLIPEDGCLPTITSSGLAPFNNIMIIKIPEQYRKPGETIFQFATLDPSQSTEKWPADKFLEDPAGWLLEVEEAKKQATENDEGSSDFQDTNNEACSDETKSRLNVFEPRKENPNNLKSKFNSINRAVKDFESQKQSFTRKYQNRKNFQGSSSTMDSWLPPLACQSNSDQSTLLPPTFNQPKRGLLGDRPSWSKRVQDVRPFKHSLVAEPFNHSLVAENNLRDRRPEISNFTSNNMLEFTNYGEPFNMNQSIEISNNTIESSIETDHLRDAVECPRTNLFSDNLDSPFQNERRNKLPFNDSVTGAYNPPPIFDDGYNDSSRQYPSNYSNYRSNRKDNFNQYKHHQYSRNSFPNSYDRTDSTNITSYNNRSHLPVTNNYENIHQNGEVWNNHGQASNFVEPFRKPEDGSQRSKYLPRNHKRFWRGNKSGQPYQNFKRNKNNRGRGNYTFKNKTA